LGQIKTLHVKSLAKTLIEKYPDKFSKSFEKNKKEMDKIVEMESKIIRNQVAGYLVHLVGKKENPPSFEMIQQTKEIKQRRERGRGRGRRR
jgi:small subunit ribosomal protein S17e